MQVVSADELGVEILQSQVRANLTEGKTPSDRPNAPQQDEVRNLPLLLSAIRVPCVNTDEPHQATLLLPC